jgi:hypothetical protein
MKILLLILLGLAGLLMVVGVGLYCYGRFQPARHTAGISFTLPKPRAAVWAALTDYAALPQWWPAVKSVRFETRVNGDITCWNTDRHGKEIGFRTTAEQAPAHLVREIVGADLPFGGIWTYDLVGESGASRVTLREDG